MRPSQRRSAAPAASGTSMVGEDDVLTPPALHEEMAAAIPAAVLEILPGSGHLPTMEVPEAAGAALRRWMTRI